jgi:hypothetical protein
MYVVAQRDRAVRLVATMCAPLALVGMFAPTTASAQISETVTISNNYGTAFPPLEPLSTAGGPKVTLFSGAYAPNAQSELGVNYTATADEDGFFFLHDNFCVGACDTISDTTITFTVENTNDGLESIWFHSQITPGHLAEIYDGGATGATAGFDFSVSRIFGNDRSILYSASGGVNSDGIFLNTGDLIYNGLRRQTGDNYDLLDWQTTNLGIFAGELSGFETMQLEYRATYWSSSAAACADVFACPGVQVVFGDPRNNGGTNFSAFAALLDEPELPEPGLAVIGADYGAVFVPYAFTNNGTSPFDDPVLGADLSYDPLYRSRGAAVPEPESWALMIVGFGAVGTAMRRRRSRLRTAKA